MNYRAAKLALFFLGFTVFFGSSPAAHAQSAKSLFKQGENAEAREDYETAFEDYRKAFQKDPNLKLIIDHAKIIVIKNSEFVVETE